MRDRILIIDDSPEWPQRLRGLGEGRFEVIEARDHHAVLPQLSSSHFQTIVCDPARVDGQGLECLRRVREAAPYTPLVILTGAEDPHLLEATVEAAEPYRLAFKPIEEQRLLEVVEAAVAHDRSGQEARELEQELATAHDTLREITAGLEERLTDQVAGLRILHRFALDLNTTESLESIARLAAQATFDLLGGRGVHVQIWDDELSGRVVRADVGPEMSTRMHRQPLRTSYQGQVGEIVIDLGEEGAEVPALILENLTLVAGPTAVAVTNVLRARERDQAQQATIMALARLAEQRDNETGQHIERVSRFCELVARGLRDRGYYIQEISDRFIDHLVRSAPLHDIGKVGIPDAILLKPGKLSPSEWEIMKTHASIGESTLDEVICRTRQPGYLEMGRDIAGGHHERWDGSGYPRGLSGESIPLSARILALADIYDALTSNRPYKKAWSHEDAVEYIAGLSGNHLDPKLVEVFVDLQEQANRIRGELSDEGKEEVELAASVTV